MPCARIGNAIVCYAPVFSAVDENGKRWEWETDYTGCPWLHRKDGELSKHQKHLNDENHPFWKVYRDNTQEIAKGEQNAESE